MGGYWRTEDGTCVAAGCTELVEYVGVLQYGDTDSYDYCKGHYVELAQFNTMWAWWTQQDPPDGATCPYPTRPSPTETVPCNDPAQLTVSRSLDGTEIPACKAHYQTVVLENVLLETGWSGYPVDPGWTPSAEGEGPAEEQY